jgi:hypothetical protein
MATPADIEATLEEHVAWITAVAKDAEHRGAPAIQEAIAGLEDEQKDGMLFVLLSIVTGTVARTREAIRDEIAKQQFEGLDGNGGPTLH